MHTISSQSKEQVQVPVTMRVLTGLGNPSADPVYMAFLATTADPQPSDWKAATWEQTASGGWVMQCLVGPGGTVTLAKGVYYVWGKIVDPTETVVESLGMLEVA